MFKVTTTADREFDQIRKWDEPDDSWWAAVLTQSSSATQQLPLSDLFCLKRCRKLLHQSSRVKCLFAEKCWCFKLKSLWEVLYPFILKLELQFNSQYKPNVLPQQIFHHSCFALCILLTSNLFVVINLFVLFTEGLCSCSTDFISFRSGLWQKYK